MKGRGFIRAINGKVANGALAPEGVLEEVFRLSFPLLNPGPSREAGTKTARGHIASALPFERAERDTNATIARVSATQPDPTPRACIFD